MEIRRVYEMKREKRRVTYYTTERINTITQEITLRTLKSRIFHKILEKLKEKKKRRREKRPNFLSLSISLLLSSA